MSLASTQTLRRLIAEFGVLSVARGMTAQGRGRRLDSLVAEVLRCWGIDAETNVRGSGGRDQIDVVFATVDARFVLEAKWHTPPLPAGPIGKLFDRLRSRATGTFGVVLSMSGYTTGAIDEASHSRWPNILLLDRSHFEAMLCGLISPADLLGAALRHASYAGGTYPSLADLLLPRQPAPPLTLAAIPPAILPWPLVRGTAGGVRAHAVLVGDGGWEEMLGMAAGRVRGTETRDLGLRQRVRTRG